MVYNKISIILAIVLFAFQISSSAGLDTKIVNGTNAEEGEFKFMISLRNASRHTCGGTILSKDYVLTAAHCVCVNSANVSRLTIQYGLLEINTEDENSIQVQEIICNQGYDPSAYYIYDIAILKLEEAIPKEYVYPTKLAEPDFNTSETLNGMVIGWGRNATNAYLPTILQKVDVKIYSNSICNAAHGGVVDLAHHICSGVPENGKGSCQVSILSDEDQMWLDSIEALNPSSSFVISYLD